MTQDHLPAQGLSHLFLPKAMAGCAVALAAITVAQAALPSRPFLSAPREERPPAAEEPDPAPAVRRIAGPFDWARPVADPVISPFGLRQLPWEEHGRLHAGVDMAAPAGTPVLAAAHGVVVRAGRDGGYGYVVELRHAGGLSSLSAHLGAIAPGLKPGTAVMQGTPIGSIGSTGSSTGSHLHFEIRDRRGRPLNPEMFMGRRFASAESLPLAAAGRFPRRVRIAYVSFIPEARREEMETRQQEKLDRLAAHKAAQTVRGLTAAAKAAEANPVDLPVPRIVVEEAATGAPSRLPSGRVQASFEAAT